MSVYAVVAVKGLDTSKKRLSIVLSPQRAPVNIGDARRRLNALQTSTIKKIVVVSNDFALSDFAGKFNAAASCPKNQLVLNPAVEEATEWCIGQGAQACWCFQPISRFYLQQT